MFLEKAYFSMLISYFDRTKIKDHLIHVVHPLLQFKNVKTALDSLDVWLIWVANGYFP